MSWRRRGTAALSVLLLAVLGLALPAPAGAAPSVTGYLAFYPNDGQSIVRQVEVVTADQVGVLGDTHALEVFTSDTSVDLSAPSGQQLAGGQTWLGAQEPHNATGHAGLAIGGNGATCSGGRFTVDDARDDATGHLAALAARFEVHCGDSYVLGEVSLGEPLPPGPLVVPARIAWPGTAPSTTPAPVPVTVLNTTADPVAVGAASVSGSAFALGDSTCGSTLAAGSSCTVTALYRPPGEGTFSGSLAVPVGGTTRQVPLAGRNLTGASYLRLSDPAGDWVLGGSSIPADFTPDNSRMLMRGGGNQAELDVHDSADQDWTVILRPALGAQLGVGTFAVDASNNDASDPDLVLAGAGRGCAGQRGSYTIRQIAFEDGRIVRLAGAFDIRCNGSDGVTHGAFGWRQTSTPSAARLSPLPTWTLGPSARLAWSSGGSATDLRYRRVGSGYVYPSAWQGTTATTAALALAPGTTVCASIRPSGSSSWSTETCTARPLDDRHLRPSSGWSLGRAAAYLDGTISLARTAGRTLVRPGVTATRIAIVATTCGDCGRVAVLWNGALLGVVSLRTSSVHYRSVLPVVSWSVPRTGTLTLRSVDGNRVYVDGVGTSRS